MKYNLLNVNKPFTSVIAVLPATLKTFQESVQNAFTPTDKNSSEDKLRKVLAYNPWDAISLSKF